VKTIKLRPIDCCSAPVAPEPLAQEVRERLVAVFRALGDATRFDIFRLIAAQPESICVCDVVDRFPVSQPTISHHLKVLRDAGLVTVARRGVWAYYAVTDEGRRVLGDAQHVVAGEGTSCVMLSPQAKHP
jgi:ArsR family transcriptional regulator